MADTQGERVQLEAGDMMEDPDTFATFAERNRFRDRQHEIYRILRQPVVLLSLEDGRTVRIQPQESRPLSSLPLSSWLLSLYGAVALLVGTAVWSVRQQSVPTKFLLLSGIGAVVLLNSVKVFALRELALDGPLYAWLAFGYHLGNNMFALGIIGLIWRFPKHLGRFPVDYVLIVYMAFFMLNENLEWTDLPGNSVLIQVPFYIIVSMVIMVMQWMKSHDNPVDRATVKALVLMIWILIFAISGTYLTNVMVFGDPRITLTNSFFGMFFVYIMMSLAVVRYRLFEIDRWWFEIWLWFFAGASIVAFDVMLISFAGVAPSYALGISIVLAGWVYFPARQWVWRKVFPGTRRNLEEYVPLLVGHFVQADERDRLQVWQRVLRDVFQPLSIEAREIAADEVDIVDNGMGLVVPCLLPDKSLELHYADKGARLFNNNDLRLSRALLHVTRTAMEHRERSLQEIADERKRIMRDLHDDVGGRLLTLTHAGEAGSGLASEALNRLREIIYSLDLDQEVTLNGMAAEWRIEALGRCELANVNFEWGWEEPAEDVKLSPRQSLNLTLTLRESLSNALAHAQATEITFDLKMQNGSLDVEICNDGVGNTSGPMNYGKGLRNMQARIEELGGDFESVCEAGKFRIRFSVPLGEGEYA